MTDAAESHPSVAATAHEQQGTGPEQPATGLGQLVPGLVRRVRRIADLSQRELAARAGVSPATIARLETGCGTPALPVLERVLRAAGLRLVAVDSGGRTVPPLEVWDGITDLAGRRLPAHLDTIVDPERGEWWADRYGLTRPPETFRRDRSIRDYERRRSRWEVRVAQTRHDPPPRNPAGVAWRPRPLDSGC